MQLKFAFKNLLIAVAISLSVLVVALIVFGFATDWQGARPYPNSPRAGAFTTSQRILQDLEMGLYDELSLEEAHQRINWENALTHWHSVEDVTIDVTSSDGLKVDGGMISFRATTGAPAYTYYVDTGKILEQ